MDNQLPTPNTPLPNELPGTFKPQEIIMPAVAGAEAVPTPSGGALPVIAPLPAATPPIVPVDTASVVGAPNIATTPAPSLPTPNVAGDVDVIEPEWVEKAEQVMHEHAGDPYGEEEAIEGLQQDYLQKRYGIAVEDPNPDDTKPKGV